MYVKCGNIEYTLKLFQSLNDNKNVSIWNAMTGGLTMNGRSKEALGLFSEMERTNIKPDEITFVGVLSACRHGGLIDEAWHIYDKMNRVYGIEPGVEHYGCTVDLISRLGRLSEAEDMTAKMTMRPQVSTWSALLAACKIHGDVKLGERVAKHLLKLDPNHVGCRVMLSNLYAEAGFWDKVAEVRRGMKSLSKTPGWSLIEVE
ncbi:pentatricopeptide repeat-containing protein At1g08070, chloroplastic-like [Amborella trichopoda]|uniref:pentatricopeptide repeat-containing protein At1g08070, chloroplastic-like n=1 Tax=Amborella trichopoda TaxID=13333 RepID=UPI0005D3CA4E|nr:pentatricopeptide repeat-containing protein At1g08070, chloroplastic-like [Amborella trichopoda]|eukprot:XP_011628762.1 pentatricopeptide repeat-containing protein At1g08070, chloroplastic-like [Amborella trichopoda]